MFVVRKVFIFFYYVFNLYDNKIVLGIFIIVRVFLYYISNFKISLIEIVLCVNGIDLLKCNFWGYF